MLDAERTQLNKVRAQERMRAQAAHDAFVANLQQAAQQHTQASLESYERLAAETETSLANRDDMLNQTERLQGAFVQPLQQQLEALGDCGGGFREQVLTSLQTVESNSARLNSGVDQVFQDFRVRTLEPSDREVAADCQQMEAQITNTAGSDVRTATSSVKALNELAVEMKTDIETIRILGFVFGGCCSNAYFLELGTSAVPSAGTLITFAQSLATALTCIPTQFYRPPGSSSLLPRLKAPKVPSSRWSVQIILYLTTSLLKNAAFAYDIPMSVHL
ncbi:golgi uridine diphosphate-N- acetylglucosamine transporter, partial [Tilletia horrida]